MQETFKAASADDVIMMRQRLKASKLHVQKMELLFKQSDVDHDGHLSVEEFRNVVKDEFVKTWLGSMELEADDADDLFWLLDSGDGTITAEQLIKGAARLKGTARSMDLARTMRHTSCSIARIVQLLEDKRDVRLSQVMPSQSSGAVESNDKGSAGTGSANLKGPTDGFDLTIPSSRPRAYSSEGSGMRRQLSGNDGNGLRPKYVCVPVDGTTPASTQSL